jgi:hypothetical protein
MCTAILKEDFKKGPKIAKTDMVVYKVNTKDILNPEVFRSEYQTYTYRINDLHDADIIVSDDDECVSDGVEHAFVIATKGTWGSFHYILRGFHAYVSLARVKQSWKPWIECTIGRFIIPKGAQYYKNACGNIVSNQIIFKEFVK